MFIIIVYEYKICKKRLRRSRDETRNQSMVPLLQRKLYTYCTTQTNKKQHFYF